MRLYKRLFIISLSSIYFFGICDSNLFAIAKTPARKTRSKTRKTVKKRSSGSIANTSSQQETTSSSETANTNTNTNATATEKTNTTNTENTTTANNTTEDTTANKEEATETETVLSEDQQVQNVPKDEKWEDFKFCMQQQCMGGPEQPLNVECYKNLNFDNAFQSCKVMIGDMTKYKLFERYFKEILLIEEQEAACASMFSGTWDKNEHICNIEITFTRKYTSKVKNLALKNDKVGCNDNKKIVKGISANKELKFTCSYTAFGLDACYSDPASATANEIGFAVGIGTTIVGAGAGVAAGLAAGFTAKGDTKYNDKGERTGKEELNGAQKAFTGIVAGMQAGNGMIMEGVGQIVTATASSKDVGNPVNGTCRLPDGTIYTEGSILQLSW